MPGGPPQRQPQLRPELVLQFLRDPDRATWAGGNENYSKQVVSWLQKNPGWTAKNFGQLSQLKGAKLLGKAGFYTRSRGNKWVVRNPYVSDKDLWTFTTRPPVNSATAPMPIRTRKDKDKPAGSDKQVPPPDLTTENEVDPVLAGLAGIPGLDLTALEGVRVPKVGGIPLSLADGGARPMTGIEIDALVKSIVNPQRTKKLFEHDRADLQAQTKHNIGQLDNWYGQVMDSQGVAAQRSADFGKAAVEANAGVTKGIISSLGGEANEGSYVVGAAGAENAGLLNALGAIENQYNADITPLLQAEAAGQKAREQAAGTARLRDLSRQLMESETQGSAAEAQLRYDVWQRNQQILNDRVARRIGIIQANQGLKQQGFQNELGLAQAGLAAQASQANLGLQTVGAAADYLDDQADNSRQSARDAYLRKPKPYGQAAKSIKDSAWNDMIDLVDGRKMKPQQAMNAMASVIRQYGWNPNAPGPRALMQSALKEWEKSLSE